MWRDLWLEASLDFPYLALIVSSCAIATFGLVANSAAVIIGAMIIAPLMLPIRSLAFGGLIGSWRLIRKSALAILVGTIIALAIAWLLGLLIGISEFGSEIQARSQPNLLDLGVAITAGAISGYAKIEPKISGTLAGTAIAVALMPPVCTIGLGLSQGNWVLSLGATLLYITNLLGIALSCLLVFLLAGYSNFHRARNALILTSINWLKQPPRVRLVVRTAESITPRQVELLEEFITKEMGRPFQLNVLVSKVNEVTAPE